MLLLLDQTAMDDVPVGGVPKGFEHWLSNGYEVVERAEERSDAESMFGSRAIEQHVSRA